MELCNRRKVNGKGLALPFAPTLSSGFQVPGRQSSPRSLRFLRRSVLGSAFREPFGSS